MSNTAPGIDRIGGASSLLSFLGVSCSNMSLVPGRALLLVADVHAGYAENAAIRAGFLGSNMQMISKLFALDAKIEEMMTSLETSIAPN